MPKKNKFVIDEILRIVANPELNDNDRRYEIKRHITQTFTVNDIPEELYVRGRFSMTMARVFQEMKRHEEALFLYYHMIHLKEANQIDLTMDVILLSMGRCLQEMERFEEARFCFIDSKNYGAGGKADKALQVLDELMKSTQRDMHEHVKPTQHANVKRERKRYEGFFADGANPRGDSESRVENTSPLSLSHSTYYGSSVETLEQYNAQQGTFVEMNDQPNPDSVDIKRPSCTKYRFEPYSLNCAVVEYYESDLSSPVNGF